MSVYTQEVLGLLKRNKKKTKLDKIKDHFEFGKLYRNSTINTGAAYNPTMEPFVIKWGDFKCATEEGMVRQDPTGTEERYITMWTDPVFQGECSTATITKTIISQNAAANEINIAGDLDVDNNLNVDGNAVVDLQLTAGSANILDLTDNRIVIVGPNGELEDDANFTFDGTEFNIGQGNFTVQVGTGNTQIIGTLDVDSQATLASANVEDLTEDRIVIVGPNGELEDDANFTMDGTTFTAYVNVIHGTDVPAGTPAETTTINSNLKLEGPVYDSFGNVGSLNKVLVGLADGRVKWQDDDVVEALTYGALWQGDSTNYKVELPIGNAGQILISDGTTFSWQDDPYVDGSGTLYRLPLWTPDGDSLGDSILIQNGDQNTPATQVTIEGNSIVQDNSTVQGNSIVEGNSTVKVNLTVESDSVLEGNLEVQGNTKLDSVTQDNTLTQVLVRDAGNDNEVKFRDAASIKPQVGFDTLDMLPDGWASTDGNFNAYINLDDTTTPVKNIKDMNWLVDGDRVIVIAENMKTGSLLADNAIQFPTWGSGSLVQNFASWNSPTTPAGPNLGYPTSELRFGDKVKFTGEMYDSPASSSRQMNWCSCIVFSGNQCPTAISDSYTIQEDGSQLSATVQASDDGYGSYGLTYSLVGPQPGNGTFTFTANTGAFTYQPNPNHFGVEQFQFKASDGYCESNVATITINITAVNDKPEWTSTNPVDANTYPNLTAGDQWSYTWTAADPDTSPNDLTYTVTVEDVTTSTVYTLPDANQWLTFTPDEIDNSTGTLFGQYPTTGGAWTINMTVSDNSTPALSSTDEFTIAGIVPTVDTYFVNWFDGSGSMDGAGTILSRASSIGYVRAVTAQSVTGGTSVDIVPGSPTGGSNGQGQFVNDMSDTTSSYQPYNARYVVVDGMELFTMDPTTGNETSTGAFVINQPVAVKPDAEIQLSIPVTIDISTPIVFRRTAAMKKADYDGGSAANTKKTARSFLQDFYATGLTEAQEDAQSITNNPATNGSDEFDNKVKFGWIGAGNPGEHTIRFLSNNANGPLTTNPGDQFENADTVVIAAWGDESDDYMDNLDFNSPNTTSGSQLVRDEVATLQSYIAAAEAAAGNNQIYRAIHVAVGNAEPNIAPLVDGLINGVSGSSFGGAWNDNNLKPVPNNTAPIKYVAAGYTGDPVHGVIRGVGNQTSLYFAAIGQTGTAEEVVANGQYYMSIYRERLLALGFVGI